MRTHHFGLNYVPSKRWYFCWNDWNAGDIAADFDAIAALGVDHVRVQLVWPWFQPNPTYVSPRHLERLAALMALAGERNLQVLLCPLTGWLSGYSFLPPSVGREDVFLKEAVVEQECRFFEAVLEKVGQDEQFLGFDLGNELSVLGPKLASEIGDDWARRIVAFLRPRMAGKWIVNGVDHQPFFRENVFSLPHLIEAYDAVCIHAWPKFTGALLRGGLADAPSQHLSAFLTHLARHFLNGEPKPVWIQEFGCSDLWGSGEEKERYLRRSVELAAVAGATWFTWWCSHDIEPQYRFQELEYDLGLFTTGNQPKPLAHVYRELIAQWADAPPSTPPDPAAVLGDLPTDFAPRALRELPPKQWLEQNLETTTWKLFDVYLHNVAETSTDASKPEHF